MINKEFCINSSVLVDYKKAAYDIIDIFENHGFTTDSKVELETLKNQIVSAITYNLSEDVDCRTETR